MTNVKEKINKSKKIIKNLMKKYEKYVNYLIIGAITFFISIITFKVFLVIRLPYVIAFTMSQILAIAFAYVAARKKVYNSKATQKREILIESIKFFIGRAFTYLVNLVLLVIAVDIFKFDEFYSNLVITVIVIILNYFIGDIMINKLNIDKLKIR